MPAFFAYLIAVGLLVGGGYGALNWLAEPATVKVVAKAKPRPPSPVRYTGNYKPDFEPASTQPLTPEASRSEPGSQSIGDGDRMKAASNNQPSSPQSETGAVVSAQGARAEVSGPAQQTKTETSSAEADQEAKQEGSQPAQVAPPASPGNAQSAASTGPAAAARTVSRPHPRQAGHHSEKHALALMTLRTIEYPDGRRVSQLIPYRSSERPPTFEPNE
jgi:hypothetical protein